MGRKVGTIIANEIGDVWELGERHNRDTRELWEQHKLHNFLCYTWELWEQHKLFVDCLFYIINFGP